MTEEIHDHSRVDAFMAARRRAMILHSAWRPMLAGATGAALVIGAVYVTLPRFSTREVIVDHVVQKDVTVDHVVPHDVEIDIPRIVAATPAPSTPEEKAFVGTEGWRDAIIRGRILRPDHNGFVLMTDEGEQSFYPARTGANGKIELDPSVEDDVTSYLNDLGYCRKLPVGTYQCMALHDGREAPIQQTPITRQGRPT